MKNQYYYFCIIIYRKEGVAMKVNIINVSIVIDYIESHLTEKLDLETVAQAVHYSKYHLHRVFVDTIGLTIHDYVLRRRLSESAKLLIFSNKSIIEIALISGYKSQQAFTTAFKQMYKKSPNQYRKAEEFYPLQLRYILKNKPTRISTGINWKSDIVYALETDIPAWLELVHQAIDGFPYLKEAEYLKELETCIQKKQALIIRDDDTVIGAMMFDKQVNCINFLAVHPQYRKCEIAKAFLQRLWYELSIDMPISITTFREGDKADLGYRETFKELGFAEAELLIEFGYPTQKFIIRKEDLSGDFDE